MSWFSRKSTGNSPRAARRASEEALAEWVSARRGVELFVEPKTSVTPVTMLLVAHDGEFTRKPVDSPSAAQSFAREHKLAMSSIGIAKLMGELFEKRNDALLRAPRSSADYINVPGTPVGSGETVGYGRTDLFRYDEVSHSWTALRSDRFARPDAAFWFAMCWAEGARPETA